MKREYNFHASAERMLKNHREHVEELIKTTEFLSATHGYQRIAHFSVIDDLLSYVYFLETGKWPSEDGSLGMPARPQELGPLQAAITST